MRTSESTAGEKLPFELPSNTTDGLQCALDTSNFAGSIHPVDAKDCLAGFDRNDRRPSSLTVLLARARPDIISSQHPEAVTGPIAENRKRKL
jgi:hypothetical protein